MSDPIENGLINVDEPQTAEEEALSMKAQGCPWRFYYGVIGINEQLVVFDRALPKGISGDLSPRGRRAMASYMINLWQRFGTEE